MLVPQCDSRRLVSRRDLNHWPGLGVAFALLLLLVPEAMLHTDGFFYRYRAIFAAGRAMDKLHYVESIVPTNSDTVMPRPRAIFFNDSQNSFSRLTLVLREPMTRRSLR